MDQEPTTYSRPPAPVVYLVAILGGIAGAAAAIYQEAAHASHILTVVVAAFVEEFCKPIGLLVMLNKRPGWLKSTRQIVFLAVLAAAMFATLENVLYVHVTFPNAGPAYTVFRYTVCTAMHVTASGVFGVGNSQKNADLALELAQDGALIVKLAQAFGGIEYLDKAAGDFIENWEVESYRRKQV